MNTKTLEFSGLVLSIILIFSYVAQAGGNCSPDTEAPIAVCHDTAFQLNSSQSVTLAASEISVTPNTQSDTFEFTGSLIQFQVPAGITELTITTLGGSGGRSHLGAVGGFAAELTGTFSVTPGNSLVILTGGQGGNGTGSGGGGGGGGSFVADGLTINAGNLLIASGGGGGGGNSFAGTNAKVSGSNVPGTGLFGGGGCSVSSNGSAGLEGAQGGFSPANGGNGGNGSLGGAAGGFGGGGGGSFGSGGGGGGYGGGNGGQSKNGFGGSSFNSGTNTSAAIASSFGNGRVTITYSTSGTSDNCGIANMDLTPNTFECDEVGLNTVTLTVTDVGMFIEDHDPEHIAEKIKLMLNNNEKQLEWQKNAKKATEELNWENEKTKLLTLYQNLG